MSKLTPSQIPRRSTSADNLAQLNRQSAGRASSIGRHSSINGRLSSIIGRPSMAPNKINEMSAQDMIHHIGLLLEALDFTSKHSNIPLKTLNPATATTATFYTIFEFFMKEIGVADVWNPTYLVSTNPNQPIASSQPAQNPAAVNKARIELVIFHLNFLRFPNVPKPTVFQTMTSPKNWQQMLQILYFMANLVRFLEVYDPTKLLYSTEKTRGTEVINEYLRKAYGYILKDSSFATTEEYRKLKTDSIQRFDTIRRNNLDLQQLENEHDNLKKTYGQLYINRNEFENLTQEEQDLINSIAEEEAKTSNILAEADERVKSNRNLKKEFDAMQEKLANYEAELACKDALYDEQIAKGATASNLQLVHAQRATDLEKLSQEFIENEEKKEQLHCKLMKRSQEAKDLIAQGNETINKIKLNSSLAISEFPHLHTVDLHRKTDLVKEFRDKLIVVRNQYNSEMVKLPKDICVQEEACKLKRSKIDTLTASLKVLELETKECEMDRLNLQKQMEKATEEENAELNVLKKAFLESESKLHVKRDQLACAKAIAANEYESFKKMMHQAAMSLDEEAKAFEEIKTDSICEYNSKKDEFCKKVKSDTLELKKIKESIKKDLALFKKCVVNLK